MRDEGLSGIMRGRKHRTTMPGGKDGRRAGDLLDRDFTAPAPNRKWAPTSRYAGSQYTLIAFAENPCSPA